MSKEDRTIHVNVDSDKLSALIDAKLADVGERFEQHMRNATTPKTNPTLSDKGARNADGNELPTGAPPRGPGYQGKLPVITPEYARYTLEGFRRLLQGDTRGCTKAWEKLDGYRATLVQSDEHTSGGVLVPDGFLAQVIVELPNFTPFADPALVRTLPMEQDVVRVPRVTTKPSQPGVIQEGQQYSKTQPVLGHVDLIARKVGEIIPVTYEMIMGSSIPLFNFLAELVAEQQADKRTDLLTNGLGTDEPQGIRTEADVATQGQAATALDGDDLIEAFYSIKTAYRRTGIWMMHDSIAKAVRKLKDSENRYLWTEGGGIAYGPQPTILGRPVFENPYIPTNLGSGLDESEIIFGSFRQGYWLGIRGGMTMESNSSGTDWEKDITNLKFRERYDGKVGDAAAFVRLTDVVE